MKKPIEKISEKDMEFNELGGEKIGFIPDRIQVLKINEIIERVNELYDNRK